MKKIFGILLIAHCSFLIAQTPGEWTWVSGDSIPNSSGIFGTQGIADSANKPPALYQSCSWTDHEGNFWLFGGANFTSLGGFRPYNTVWKYNVATNQWTWMKGDNAPFSSAHYGTKGVADANNNPGARYMANSWVDSSGDLWMFGGYGNAGLYGVGNMNDLWRYNISTNTWTWMKGSAAALAYGYYGHKGIADSINAPRSRCQSDSWADEDNNLWLFGGYNNDFGEYYNDLWKYNITTNEWTWMKGDSLPNGLGNFGTLGIVDSSNNPSARTCQAHWIDSSGNLWMFGGEELIYIDNSYAYTEGDDIWQYNESTNDWTWWGGGDPPIAESNNGTLCVADTGNFPTPRSETNFCWRDEQNNLWLCGGYGWSSTFHSYDAHNDLWKLYPQSKIWVRINGVDYNSAGSFGQEGVSSPTNELHARYGGVSWQDSVGNFWVFGGSPKIWNNSQSDCYNDLWRFVPDSICGVYTSSNEVAQSKNEFEVFPNPATEVLHVVSSPQKNTLTIYNSMGEVVCKKDFANDIDVDVSKFAAGIYLMRACSANGCSTRKIIIAR